MKKLLKIYVNILTLTIAIGNVAYASSGAASTIKGAIGPVLNLAAWVGYACCLGMLMYIGAKYTTAAANEKANLKEGLTNYVIGVIVIACASTIAAIISGIAAQGAGSGASGMAEHLIDIGQNF